jgi:hypothetical protein
MLCGLPTVLEDAFLIRQASEVYNDEFRTPAPHY